MRKRVMASVCRCGRLCADGKGCKRCGFRIPKLDDRPERKERQKHYDYQWKKFSRKYKQDNPLCVDCLDAGRVTPSRDVHHKQKVAEHPELKYDESNLMALCKACHDERTRRGE